MGVPAAHPNRHLPDLASVALGRDLPRSFRTPATDFFKLLYGQILNPRIDRSALREVTDEGGAALVIRPWQ